MAIIKKLLIIVGMYVGWFSASQRSDTIPGQFDDARRQARLSDQGVCRWQDCAPDVYVILTKLWCQQHKAERKELCGHARRPALALAFSHDTKMLASGGDDAVVRLWDTLAGSSIRTMKHGSGAVLSVAFHPDNKYLAAGNAAWMILLYEVATGSLIKVLDSSLHMSIVLVFAPKGNEIISGSYNGETLIADSQTGKTIREFHGVIHASHIAAFNQYLDQAAIVPQDYSFIERWDTVQGCMLDRFARVTDFVDSMALSKDSTKLALASATNKHVHIVHAGTGKLLKKLQEPAIQLYQDSFSPDGASIVALKPDGQLALWDTATGSMINTLEGSTSKAYTLALSPDGNSIATGSNDGTVQLWHTIRLPKALSDALETLTIEQLYALKIWCSALEHNRAIILPVGSLREATYNGLPRTIQEILQHYVR